jgi:ABC-type multidrug transport system fused ATPase/permease subunit
MCLLNIFQISIVSQEPTLFNCTIAKNISYGMKGTVKAADIERVAVSALSFMHSPVYCALNEH